MINDSQVLKVLGWTLKNDVVFPLPEIVLAFSLYIVLAKNSLTDTAPTDVFENLTYDLIILVILFVGIAGARGYAIALERGELSRQMIGLRISRTRLLVLKWISVFILSFAILVTIDIAAFFSLVAYIPSISTYSVWGSAPLLAFAIMVGEQAILLAFLNSLSSTLSLAIRRTTVSLLVFFLVAFLGSQLYVVGTTGEPLSYLQLGWGDYKIVLDATQYAYYSIFNHNLVSAFGGLTEQFYIGLAYRTVGIVLLLAVSFYSFKRADLD